MGRFRAEDVLHYTASRAVSFAMHIFHTGKERMWILWPRQIGANTSTLLLPRKVHT